jgi:hypothetical protein
VPDRRLDEATRRSDERRALAEQRAADAMRRAATARANAGDARARGMPRAAAVHDHEAAIHQRAVAIHQQAVRLQEQHARELVDVFGRKGVNESSLRTVVANVRRAREEAELRGDQARTFAAKARERARQLQQRRDTGEV